MWAELVVEHETCDGKILHEKLVSVFGADERDALTESINFSGKNWAKRVFYCRIVASYMLIVMRDGNDELVVYIEVTGQGTILEACQSVWKKLERELKGIDPTLGKLRLADSDSGRFLYGRAAGWRSEFKRREVFAPILVGLLTFACFLLAIFTWERASPDRFTLLYGAVAGVLMAIVIVVSVWYDVGVKKSLRWSDKDY